MGGRSGRLDHGQAVRRGQGYTLRTTPAIHRTRGGPMFLEHQLAEAARLNTQLQQRLGQDAGHD
ncbi:MULTISPECIES: hypothetical protein [Actinomadura]|uniref:hypothetical protein n=1 Tax=Actinomadura TaxID=1988 RepID=UPI0026384EEF|nr:hypothetical protein [Actinomadura geliboluensis]